MLTVVEMPSFIRSVQDILDKDGYKLLIDLLAKHPDVGDVIPGTGGLRKLRVSRPGIGKRGGARVIYYYHSDRMPVYLVYAYAKATSENITTAEKKIFSAIIDELKRQYRVH